MTEEKRVVNGVDQLTGTLYTLDGVEKILSWRVQAANDSHDGYTEVVTHSAITNDKIHYSRPNYKQSSGFRKEVQVINDHPNPRTEARHEQSYTKTEANKVS